MLEYRPKQKLRMLPVCQRHLSVMSGSNSNSCLSNQRSEPHLWLEYVMCFSIWRTRADFGWIPEKSVSFTTLFNTIRCQLISISFIQHLSKVVRALIFLRGAKNYGSAVKKRSECIQTITVAYGIRRSANVTRADAVWRSDSIVTHSIRIETSWKEISLQNEMSLNFHMIEIKAPIRLIQVSLQDYICDFVAALDSQSHQGQSLSRVILGLKRDVAGTRFNYHSWVPLFNSVQ